MPTQLLKTIELFCIVGQGVPVSHAEGMQKVGFAFRSRVSNLRIYYGVNIKTLLTRADKEAYGIDPGQAQGFYVLADQESEARRKFAEGPKTPQDAKEAPGGVEGAGNPQDANEPLPCDNQPPSGRYINPSEMGRVGCVRSGEVRRRDAKYVLCPDGKYRLRSKAKLMAESQGKLGV